jgi:hypothetical protein
MEMGMEMGWDGMGWDGWDGMGCDFTPEEGKKKERLCGKSRSFLFEKCENNKLNQCLITKISSITWKIEPSS